MCEACANFVQAVRGGNVKVVRIEDRWEALQGALFPYIDVPSHDVMDGNREE